MAQSEPPAPGKTMSSRLLTMKFMQRAAASSPAAPAGTLDEPASKKQRLSRGSYADSPSARQSADVIAVEKALAADEQKRLEALAREAADRGETKWYLSYTEPPASTPRSQLRVMSTGYSALDAPPAARYEDEDDTEEEIQGVTQLKGRRSFGKFNQASEKQRRPDKSDSGIQSGSGSSSDGDEDDDEEEEDSSALSTPSRGQADRGGDSTQRRKRKVHDVETDGFAEERLRQQQKKTTSLSQLRSISGGGGRGGSRGGKSDMVCYGCGQKGHARKDCPQRSR